MNISGNQKLLVVVGGGAAGFFCAVNAARLNPQLKVLLVEKTGKLLSKVKISGGGRCNVTHACFDITEMSKRYPRGHQSVRKAFYRFFTTDTVKWFEERGVQLKSEADGRMFPVTDSSQTIINCLLHEARQLNVEIVTGKEVTGIEKTGQKFQISLLHNESISTDFICIASGGYPKQTMFNWLLATGHDIESPVPSLFTFNLPKHPITSLMGVSVETARIKIEGSKLEETGPVLITHWGLSGPAVLKLSARGARILSEKKYSFKVQINWLPGRQEQLLKQEILQQKKAMPLKQMANINFTGLPNRLWSFLLEQASIPATMRAGELPAKLENQLIRILTDHALDVEGKTTFKEEFVTAGGIRLNQVDPQTMMSKKIPGLYFAGEVMDVDGITGGYNFQHAWTSGFIAASSIAREAAAGS